jgi:hypothetical protein
VIGFAENLLSITDEIFGFMICQHNTTECSRNEHKENHGNRKFKEM